MKLTKQQIAQIEKCYKKADLMMRRAFAEHAVLAELIADATGVEGMCDYLQGDGIGFTPYSNNDTHIHLDDLIAFAKKGEDITEELILNNLSI